MFLSHLIASVVSGHSNQKAVFHLLHLFAVVSRPAAFILCLVEEIIVMAVIMVQHPEVGCYAGVQGIEKFDYAIGD